ncbi:MAG: DUF1553 domain-containing protein [Rubripirellula sp.]|nr:DUF1553 domain-containing protein [Rubripirellula sp.]
MRSRLHTGLLCLLFAAITTASTASSPSQLAHDIDRLINQQCAPELRAELVGESQYIRRATLDLAGRIPTIAELQDFRDSESLTKRQDLIQRLIRSADFAFHQRNELDTLLLRRLEHNDKWRAYLLEATRENRKWDDLFRQIMVPEDDQDNRPAAFLRKRIRDLDTTTNDSSIVWFGVNIGCAKCHDHPLVMDWTQALYYGLASFFNRTFHTRAGSVGERFDGSIGYTTTDGESRKSEFMFLTGTKLEEPDSELAEAKQQEISQAIKKAESDAKSPPPPQPQFRPRSRLVETALADTDQNFFARNIVNRLWARMFGRGLIHPLDQAHSENPPSHPALLDLLANDLREHDFDLRRTLHAIALTDTYARKAHANDPPPDELFAGAIPRPLAPHQLSLSLLIASANPMEMQGLSSEQDWNQRREELEQKSESVAKQLEIPDDGFQVSVTESLWFSNHPQIQNEYLQSGGNHLVGSLLRFESDEELIRAAIQSVLSRDPDPDEMTALLQYLESKTERRTDAVGQIVWALMSSPEFRFNH